MKNKLYLTPDEIRETLDLGTYGKEFTYPSADAGGWYIPYRFEDIADMLKCEIDEDELAEYIGKHIDDVNDTIIEYGWEAYGSLYAAGLATLRFDVVEDLEEHLGDNLRFMALDYMTNPWDHNFRISYDLIPAALWDAVEKRIDAKPNAMEEIIDIIDNWDNAHRFDVYEDNDTVTLIIYSDNNSPKYVHRYYGETPGQLAQDLQAYFSGDCPADDWDGNELDELVEHAGGLDNLVNEYSRPGVAQIAKCG